MRHCKQRQPAAVAGDIGEEHAVVGAGSGGKKILKIGVPIRDTPIYKSGSKMVEKPNNALLSGGQHLLMDRQDECTGHGIGRYDPRSAYYRKNLADRRRLAWMGQANWYDNVREVL